MSGQIIKYQGYIIRTYPEYLSTEERLARKEWRAIVKSWGYTIRRNCHGFQCDDIEGFLSEEQAIEDAMNRIDAVLDSL